MTKPVEITEYLAIDLADERWQCRRCDHDLGSARRNYKEGCAVADRDPREIHEAVVDGEYTFAPDPEWCRIVEVKYFLGLTDEEAAEALGIKIRTLQRMWFDARQWLFTRLKSGERD